MTKYVIMKDKNAARRRSPFDTLSAAPEFPFSPLGLPTSATASTVPPEPELTTESLDASGLRDAIRDPDVVQIARSMPTRLIEPTASDAQADGTTTWGVSAVGADVSNVDGSDVLVAVLDTGIDAAHAAFAGMNLTEKDFSGSGNGDVQGHGTHCAGTIFGRDVDGQRIGVAPGVIQALIGKVLGDDGRGGSEMLFDAIQWASSNDAQVISMSLGFDFPGLSKDLVDQGFPVVLATSVALEGYRANLRMFDSLMAMIAARAAFNGGTVVVAASGNESSREIDPNFEVSASLPAAAQGIVSVGALGEQTSGLSVADFSNTNPIVSAPGVGVLSAKVGGGLRALNGTSMACPHVAGVAALWWQSIRGLGIPVTAQGVVTRLRAACRTDVFLPGVDILDRGDGLVQAPSAAVS